MEAKHYGALTLVHEGVNAMLQVNYGNKIGPTKSAIEENIRLSILLLQREGTAQQLGITEDKIGGFSLEEAVDITLQRGVKEKMYVEKEINAEKHYSLD